MLKVMSKRATLAPPIWRLDETVLLNGRAVMQKVYFIGEILSPWGTSGINLKEIEGYALFLRFVEIVLDVEHMRIPRKYFSGEILSP